MRECSIESTTIHELRKMWQKERPIMEYAEFDGYVGVCSRMLSVDGTYIPAASASGQQQQHSPGSMALTLRMLLADGT